MSSTSSTIPPIELTDGHVETLQLLVECYRERGAAVKGCSVVDRGEQDPTTIRSHLRNLKALQLVKGIAGPKGGYKPTGDGYRALDRRSMDEAAAVPLARNGERIEHVTVRGIDLVGIRRSERCRAEIRLREPIEKLQAGDTVIVGPTPNSRLTITGHVDEIVDDGLLAIDVERMTAPGDRCEES